MSLSREERAELSALIDVQYTYAHWCAPHDGCSTCDRVRELSLSSGLMREPLIAEMRRGRVGPHVIIRARGCTRNEMRIARDLDEL